MPPAPRRANMSKNRISILQLRDVVLRVIETCPGLTAVEIYRAVMFEPGAPTYPQVCRAIGFLKHDCLIEAQQVASPGNPEILFINPLTNIKSTRK